MIQISGCQEQILKNTQLKFPNYRNICFQICPLQGDEINKDLAQLWPGCKLLFGMAKTENITEWCPEKVSCRIVSKCLTESSMYHDG